MIFFFIAAKVSCFYVYDQCIPLANVLIEAGAHPTPSAYHPPKHRLRMEVA